MSRWQLPNKSTPISSALKGGGGGSWHQRLHTRPFLSIDAVFFVKFRFLPFGPGLYELSQGRTAGVGGQPRCASEAVIVRCWSIRT